MESLVTEVRGNLAGLLMPAQHPDIPLDLMSPH
jgi:hypothetical protein